mgnify:CR=1 FL=1
MKHNSKKITAAICLIAAISSFSVMANAQEMPATQAGNIQENISYTNSPLFFYLNMLQNKLCPNFPPFQLPGAGCPDNTLPGPDFPAYPGEDNETPELPEVPGTPETPELPENPGDTMSQFQQEVVELVNQERAKAGLNPLTVNADVTAAARIRCVEQTSSFSHTRPNGSSFSTVLDEQGVNYMSAGENIAYGQRTPEEVMNAWMNSQGHRENILNSRYTSIGVGCYQSSNGTLYWTQLFIS